MKDKTKIIIRLVSLLAFTGVIGWVIYQSMSSSPSKKISPSVPEASTHSSDVKKTITAEDGESLNTAHSIDENSKKMLQSYLQQSDHTIITLSEKKYGIVRGVKSCEDNNYTPSLGKKIAHWYNFIIYAPESLNDAVLDLEDKEMAVLINQKNQQIALLLNRFNIRYYHHDDLQILQEVYQLELVYQRKEMRFASFVSKDTKSMMKNYYLLKEDPRVDSVELEIIENPSVPK